MTFIENVWTFSFISWFYNLTVKQRHSLQKKKTANFGSKIICDKVGSLSLFCDQQILLKVHLVVKDLDHALCGEFQRLPHGRPFRSLVRKTNRGGNSFVPKAIRLLNRT